MATGAKIAASSIVAVLPLAIGIVAGRFSSGNTSDQQWFDRLRKPVYMPPPVVFSVVWPVLYALIGAAIFFATYEQSALTMAGLYALLALNLAFNYAYPFLMFRARMLVLSSLVTWLTLATALILMAAMIHAGEKRLADPVSDRIKWMCPVSVWLLAPYVAWLVLASVMSTDVYLCNRP